MRAAAAAAATGSTCCRGGAYYDWTFSKFFFVCFRVLFTKQESKKNERNVTVERRRRRRKKKVVLPRDGTIWSTFFFCVSTTVLSVYIVSMPLVTFLSVSGGIARSITAITPADHVVTLCWHFVFRLFVFFHHPTVSYLLGIFPARQRCHRSSFLDYCGGT